MNPVTAYRFITANEFAVVGASTDRSKYGNRVLRWYQANSLPVIPVNHKESAVESIPAIASIDKLKDPSKSAISIITPPKVTLQVLKQAKELGIEKIWLQPGAEDKDVMDYAREAGLDIIAGGPCILVQGPSLMTHRSASL
ncbi:CoA-binding protein [Zychaea mexicana]|uniref:CoA-binding protein n=1 Tax=Zychaea mexicana TaxID=64656 RepID=UPI0022FF42CC|nr:CoA-binding protein [Zychaea mexicana]KAI9490409.1 CoA-binding protein [Zychaea mexicana]